MKITSKTTCLGFLLALSTLSVTKVEAKSMSVGENSLIEARLSRLTDIIHQKELELSQSSDLLARGWANGSRGSWVNGRRGGFADRHGGGGFYNRRWGDGGRFYNRPIGGGSFLNRW